MGLSGGMSAAIEEPIVAVVRSGLVVCGRFVSQCPEKLGMLKASMQCEEEVDKEITSKHLAYLSMRPPWY